MNASQTIEYIQSKLSKEGACCLIIENEVKYVAKVHENINQVVFNDGTYTDLSPIDFMNQVRTPEELISPI